MKTISITALLLAGAVLTGCGGSGSSSSTTPASTAAKVSITAQNESTITNSALKSATQNLGTSNLSYVGGVQTTSSTNNERMLSNWSAFSFNKLLAYRNAPQTVAGVTQSASCSTSGTITFDTDGNSTAPTYFTLTFNNCVEGTSTTNGSISMSGISITQNASVVTGISANFSFNLSTTNSGTTSSIIGGFNIAASGIGTATRTDSISGTTLSVAVASQYETLRNFTFVSTYDDTTLSHGYSDTVDYTFASDVILAGFDFHTVNALVRNFGDAYPRSGQVIITGANSTKLRATVDSSSPYLGTASGTVQLELSQDGGVTYGSAVTKTWAQIAAGN